MEGKRISDNSLLKDDAEKSALFMLGKIIVRKTFNKEIKHRITELEIYKQNDSACHAYKGKTKRNAPIFEEGGTIYVYLCYGIHYLLNISTGQKDDAQCVLIRGIDNVFGSGKIGKMLQVDTSLNFQNVASSQELWLEDDGFVTKQENILKEKRVGIGYAKEEDQNLLWRFRLKSF